MFKIATSAFALATIFSLSAASATDLKGDPTSANYVAERPVSWTGFYVGVQGGYGNANHDLTVQQYKDTVGVQCLSEDDGGSPLLSEGACGEDVNGWTLGAENGASINLFNIDGVNSSGFIGGVRAGFDKQIGSRLVVGVFGAYAVSSMATAVDVTGLGSASLEKNDEWSLGGRVGLLLSERTMAYIMAAYTQTEYDLNGIMVPPKVVDQDRRNYGATFDGVTVGGGFEHALTDNVFIGLEYTHTFYGSETIFDEYDAICNEGTRIIDDLDEDKIMATLKIKLNSSIASNFGL